MRRLRRAVKHDVSHRWLNYPLRSWPNSGHDFGAIFWRCCNHWSDGVLRRGSVLVCCLQIGGAAMTDLTKIPPEVLGIIATLNQVPAMTFVAVYMLAFMLTACETKETSLETVNAMMWLRYPELTRICQWVAQFLLTHEFKSGEWVLRG